MASLLSFTSSFEATDARDKLFALVGLLPEASPERLAFQPDYTANARQLFIRVAKYFLQTTRKLDVMTARPQMPYYYRLRSKPESYATPPSWAADWQQPQVWMYNSIWISRFSEFKTLSMFMHDEEKEDDTGHDSHDSHDCGHDLHAAAPEEPIHTGEIPGPAAQLQHKANGPQLFNASLCEESPFPFEFSACDEVLHVRGIPVDTIEEVGVAWDLGLAAVSNFKHGDRENSIIKAHEAQVSIIEKWKTITRVEDEGTYAFMQQTRREAFWRTLLLDRYRFQWQTVNTQPSFRRVPLKVRKKDVSEIFGGNMKDFPPKDTHDETWLIWYMRHEVTELWSFGSVNLHCANLSFFRTVRRYFGVCHPDARPGDTVAVLMGAPVPLILREYDEGHLIVGQRYVVTVACSLSPTLHSGRLEKLKVDNGIFRSYVHGIMDGEIIQAEADQGRGKDREDFKVFSII